MRRSTSGASHRSAAGSERIFRGAWVAQDWRLQTSRRTSRRPLSLGGRRTTLHHWSSGERWLREQLSVQVGLQQLPPDHIKSPGGTRRGLTISFLRGQTRSTLLPRTDPKTPPGWMSESALARRQGIAGGGHSGPPLLHVHTTGPSRAGCCCFGDRDTGTTPQILPSTSKMPATIDPPAPGWPIDPVIDLSALVPLPPSIVYQLIVHGRSNAEGPAAGIGTPRAPPLVPSRSLT